MHIKLSLSNRDSDVASSIIEPGAKDIKSSIAKVRDKEMDLIDIVCDGNHMFLMESGNRWLIKYSGTHNTDFVNAILTDPKQSSTDEILFSGAGQIVDYVMSETVSEDTAITAAAYFAEQGKLYEHPDFPWHFVDQVPLEE